MLRLFSSSNGVLGIDAEANLNLRDRVFAGSSSLSIVNFDPGTMIPPLDGPTTVSGSDECGGSSPLFRDLPPQRQKGVRLTVYSSSRIVNINPTLWPRVAHPPPPALGIA